MKKLYVNPLFEISTLSAEDILTFSGDRTLVFEDREGSEVNSYKLFDLK